MVEPIFDIFSIQPDESLSVIQPRQSLAELTKALLDQLSPLIAKVQPSGVLIQGDTTSCLVGALAAFYNHIPIGHVEAGLRTNNLEAPFPEEGNRQLVSRLANIHFAPTFQAAKALYKENIKKESVSITGNTVIDSLFTVIKMNRANNLNALAQICQDRRIERPYVLATLHRREIFGETIRNMMSALTYIASCHPGIDVVLTSHPNPNVQAAIDEIMYGKSSFFKYSDSIEEVGDSIILPNLKIIPPQPYHFFVDLMSRAHLILSDSGGVQEEAPSLNRPVLVLRDKTERKEGVEAGCLVQVGTDPRKIVDACTRLLNDDLEYAKIAQVSNPYGDGLASSRICKFFRDHLMKYSYS